MGFRFAWSARAGPGGPELLEGRAQGYYLEVPAHRACRAQRSPRDEAKAAAPTYALQNIQSH